MKILTYEAYARMMGLNLGSLTIGKRGNLEAKVTGEVFQTLTLTGNDLRFLAEIAAVPVMKGEAITTKVTSFKDYSKLVKGEKYVSVWDKLRADTESTTDIRVAEGNYMVLYKGMENVESYLSFTNHFPGKIVLIDLEDDESIKIAKGCFFASDDKIVDFKVDYNSDFNIITHSQTSGVFTNVTGGNVFVEAYGDCNVIILKPGEKAHIWPGHLVAYTPSAKIKMTKTSNDPLYLEKRGYFDIEITAVEADTIVYVQTGNMTKFFEKGIPKT